jgi:ornithine cyclodeaminase/alanine dehydrogenase-like protein (mu-crystallin family)
MGSTPVRPNPDGRGKRLLAETSGLQRVQVWGRRPELALARACDLAAEGLPAQAVGELEAAVRGACIVWCATAAGARRDRTL